MKRLLLCLLLPALLLSSCTARPAGVSQTGYYFDTVVTLTLYDGPESALEGAMALCRRYESLFSATSPDSELYRLNHNGGQPMELSAETAELLALALRYCESSGGLFDVTVAAYSELWDFKAESPVLPSEEELAEAAGRVGYQRVRLEGGTATLSDGAQVELGAIAKGYVAGKLAEYLRGQGVASALLDLGGSVYCLGGRPDGTPFTVGIQTPYDNRLFAALSLRDQAVATSGDYQRGFTLDGVRYHHILDPATGMPARTGLSSVTVLSSDPAQADALSTLCFLLGADQGIALLESTPGVEGVFYTQEGEVRATSGAPLQAVQ